MKTFNCKNGMIIRPVKRTIKRVRQWHYQVAHVGGGFFPSNRLGRTEDANRAEIEAIGAQNGGGKWV